MIYVPNLSDYACVYLKDKDTLRAYKQQPNFNSTSEYVDYYVNSHYLFTQGTQEWGNSTYYNSLPVCLNSEKLTNDFYYRNDFASILFIFIVFAIVILYFPIKIWSRIFKKKGV